MHFICATSPTCSCPTADPAGYEARSNGQVASLIEIVDGVIAVIVPAALTDVSVSPAEPPDDEDVDDVEDADATDVAVTELLDDVTVVLAEVPVPPWAIT